MVRKILPAVQFLQEFNKEFFQNCLLRVAWTASNVVEINSEIFPTLFKEFFRWFFQKLFQKILVEFVLKFRSWFFAEVPPGIP